MLIDNIFISCITSLKLHLGIFQIEKIIEMYDMWQEELAFIDVNSLI
jgi:hypothetical protein